MSTNEPKTELLEEIATGWRQVVDRLGAVEASLATQTEALKILADNQTRLMQILERATRAPRDDWWRTGGKQPDE